MQGPPTVIQPFSVMCFSNRNKTWFELLEVFEDDRAVYLVSEFCPGGSLYDYLAALQKCPEELARTWALQMVQAIGYLQGCGIVHRNLRLESWQLTRQEISPPLKLHGLSHSTRWHKKEGRLNAACGILAYTSPDVLLGRYTDACDMWSLGVIVYQLLCGRPPFVGTRQEKIRQILSGDVNMLHLEKAGVSEEAKSFVTQLLTLSPHNRLTPQRALEHTSLVCQQQPTTPRMVGRLFAGASHSSIGRLTAEDLRRTLQREQAEPFVHEEVEAIFDALDINKDGEIMFTVFAAAMIGTLVEADDSLLKKAFDKLDVNRDGRLSLDDCRWVFGETLFGQSLSAALEQEGNEDGNLGYFHFASLIRHKCKPLPRQKYKRCPNVARSQGRTHSSDRSVHAHWMGMPSSTLTNSAAARGPDASSLQDMHQGDHAAVAAALSNARLMGETCDGLKQHQNNSSSAD
ncbi:CAM kinase, CDPK family, putative [Eimeria tenella]|uniref:CAM kinase, CDPK family, putative n=1 Tax=Eimeria tenella TaxID=5802 RepID=U6KZ51_EIMTE|nr:CAM kinase, CDPK family, putative [Eimeria tenella]CDJ43412.1 CAM kinase, CDPK family, putative [Eimeria tenella]|eukprot:XP_013234162.1 CAM kinase, CDPK family, putative [Eimeria tenella]